MGKQNNIVLRGTVNGVIYYSWKGIACIRTKPATVKQAPVAKQNATVFGMAANRSAVLRALLKPLLPEPGNRKIIQRVDAAFRQWLKTIPVNLLTPVDNILNFTGLSFNEKKELSDILQVPVTVSRTNNDQLLLKIPAYNPIEELKAPANTKQVVITIMAASLQLNNPSLQEIVQTAITVDYVPGIIAAQDIPIQLATRQGSLSVVAIALQFFTDTAGKELLDKLPWKPAGIVGSFYN